MKTPAKLDRYTVLRKLAAGGMGEVFVARQEGLAGFEKTVVVKTLRQDLAEHEQFREMFFEEARVAALTRHANVVSVLDVGVSGGTYFLVMEYIEGWPLRAALDAFAPDGMPLAHVLTAAIDMARGLAHVHGLCDGEGRSLAMVHRDVSPENVMITVEGHGKLVDFGIAKRQDSPIQTDPGVLKGKARYLAPEQVRGGAVTPATDQFALGSVLFEMLTGRPLITGRSLAEVMFTLGSGDLRDPAELAPELPRSVLAVLRRTLARDPDHRFPDCARVATALAEVAEACGLRASRAALAGLLRDRLPLADPGPAGDVTDTGPTQVVGPAGSVGPGATGEPGATGRPGSASSSSVPPGGTLVGPFTPSPARIASDHRDTLASAPVTHLIGRQSEQDRIGALFAGGARLVTLLGPGGIGKTSLARHHAHVARSRRSGREVYFVDMTESRSPEDVAYQVAGSLAIELGADTAWDDAVTHVGRALAGRGASTIILDNVEQVVDAVARAVTRWLTQTDQARFLATTREPLCVRGEVRVEVAPLGRAAAIDLLCHRVQEVRPGWRPGPGDLEVAGRIVDRLDRLPLAIELAAGRGGVLGLAQLDDRLSAGLDFLRSRRRDRSGRHASLREAIAWSWQLLAGWEQDALAQCSVFRGGFTLADAEAVVVLPDDAPGDVIDAVQSLREKSLLAVQRGGDDELRFRMYESIRTYVAGELDGQVAGDVAARHLAHFLAQAEDLAARFDGLDGAECLGRMAACQGNLAAALTTAGGTSPRHTVRLVLAVERMLAARGPVKLHETWLEVGLEAARRAGSKDAEVQLLCARGRALVDRGDARAREVLTGALERAESLAGSPGLVVGEACEALGFYHLRRRELDQARPYYDRAHALYRDLGETDREAAVLGKIAVYHQRSGDVVRAGECFDRALDLHDQTGNVRAAGQLHGRRGLLRLEIGDIDRARSDLTRSIEVARDWGDESREATGLCNLGLLEMEAGNPDQARRHLHTGLRIDTRHGNRPSQAILRVNLGMVALDVGDLDAAERELDAALGIAREVAYPHVELMAVGNLGILAQVRGQLDAARDHFEACRAMQERHPPSWAPPSVFLAHLASVEAELGELERARATLAACRVRIASGGHPACEAVAACLEGFLDLERARRAGDAAAAEAHLERARGRLGGDGSRSCDLRIAQALLASALR